MYSHDQFSIGLLNAIQNFNIQLSTLWKWSANTYGWE